MKKRIILSGYGNVGREFVKLLYERRHYISSKYDLQLILCGVKGSRAAIYNSTGLDRKFLYSLGKGSDALLKYKNLSECEHIDEENFNADVLVEASYTDIASGEPGLSISKAAISRGMDIVFLSKGALVTSYKELINLAEDKKVRLKYSGAAAAALPTMDIGDYSLAGSNITSIRGILNGTTNFILTEMYEKNICCEKAIDELVKKNISEKDLSMDIKGIDSACKILLLSNSLLESRFSLKDIKIHGIENVSLNDINSAKARGKAIKLLAKAEKTGKNVEIKVCPEEIEVSDILFGVNGTNKGIIFNTDTMGEIAVLGGKSNPRAAAAASLKDIINLYREDVI